MGGEDRKDIIQILLEGNYITAEDAKKAKEHAGQEHVSPKQYLYKNEIINDDLVGQALAEYYKVGYADVTSNKPSKEQVLRIPEKSAKKYRMVVYSEHDNRIVVATSNPDKEGLEEALHSIFPGKRVAVACALDEDIEDLFYYYRKPLKILLGQILDQDEDVAPRLVEAIIIEAYSREASDIHLEPLRETVDIRFRVDGLLEKVASLDKESYELVLNRIKVMAHMRIDEHFAAQDGAIRYHMENGDEVDLRVSIAPTLGGEKITLRLLTAYVHEFTLHELGLNNDSLVALREASKQPFGMILATGPTGSGKSTTLYAVMREIYKPEINITTIEDPAEYRMEGINQIQVNKDTNLTFAQGLRSIVRQDPDVILVGEIRDDTTAKISVNAALTGHLLLSTLHSNDAATAIPRMIDMGVEPFLLASTLELVFAQRLVRKIYEPNRYSRTYSKAEFKEKYPRVAPYFDKKQITLYETKPGGPTKSGFQGRTAVTEQIQITSKMRELIMTNPSRDDVWELAKKEGSKSLFEAGLEKVMKGITTLDELLRVVPVPEDRE